MLSGSRGVIRANTAQEFVAAFERVSRLLDATDIREWRDDAADAIGALLNEAVSTSAGWTMIVVGTGVGFLLAAVVLANGRITANWPWLGIQYRRQAKFDPADFESVA